MRDFAGQTFRFYKSQLAPAHHATLMAALRRTGEKFTYQEDPIPGMKHLDLHDGKSFTLVPDSMAQHLVTTDVAAVPLTDSDLPTFNLELVWRKEGLAPATALVVSAADALGRGQRWIS